MISLKKDDYLVAAERLIIEEQEEAGETPTEE
jgi:hypothetical protein